MEDNNNYLIENNDPKNSKNKTKVNEKGEGVVPTLIDSNNSNKLKLSKEDREVDDRISNLELDLKERITNKKKEILKFIARINYSQKGITKIQLSEKFNFTRNYAQKVIYELRKNRLIISTGKRIGRYMIYFLSNMQDFIPSKYLQQTNRCDNTFAEEYSNLEKDIVMTILKELISSRGAFHNFRLQTALFDKNYYNLLDINNGTWIIQSTKNKIKVRQFYLPRYRNTTLQVSPNGMVEIYFGSSSKPYDLKNPEGLSEFIADLGKIEALFHSDLKSFSAIERFLDWKIVRLDYNKDIKVLDVSYLTSSTNILRVRYLSYLYQIYTKQLPEEGLILRIERMLSNPKPYPTIIEFISP